MARRRVTSAALALALVAGVTAWLVGFRAGASGADQTNWSLAQLRAPEAWPVSTGQGVTIGIVDSGFDPNAPDLAGRLVAAADCVGSHGDDTMCRPGAAPDLVGHGTIVASVAGQVAPGAKFVAARAVSGKLGGDDDVSAAIDWVVDHGAQVVNVSIAGVDSASVPLSPRMTDAVERAWSRGVLPVLAAGNTGGLSGYGNVDALVAGATTADGTLAPYSAQTTDVKWGVAAPGSVTMVLSSGLQILHEGTSVAAPNVAGAVALLLGHGATRDNAVQELTSTAVRCAGCGRGRIDVAAALGIPHPRPTIAPATMPPPVHPHPAPPPPEPALVVPDPNLLNQAPGLDALTS
ncbi:MAG TPA: S8 family serine peptidase [Acidimicrobiales bacterium]|jgi:subtilisin family serine protease|nr:S8 family serine peptidase [Acidimicrobiales bacterium]